MCINIIKKKEKFGNPPSQRNMLNCIDRRPKHQCSKDNFAEFLGGFPEAPKRSHPLRPWFRPWLAPCTVKTDVFWVQNEFRNKSVYYRRNWPSIFIFIMITRNRTTRENRKLSGVDRKWNTAQRDRDLFFCARLSVQPYFRDVIRTLVFFLFPHKVEIESKFSFKNLRIPSKPTRYNVVFDSGPVDYYSPE